MTFPLIQSVDANKSHSLFELINKYCPKNPNSITFHRLCSFLRKMDVKTVVIENLPTSSEEIQEECKALEVYYYNDKVEITVYRFTFLTKEISSLLELCKETKASRDLFLSNAILINYEYKNDNSENIFKSYIYSSILPIPKIVNHKKYGTLPLLNRYTHIYNTFNCKI